MPEVDYGALAEQARKAAPVDYDALAAQAREQAETPPTATSGSSATRIVAGALPAVGGMVGGIVGGPLGATVGGAAGSGYEALVKHFRELPGAIKDVARLALEEPVATAKGFIQGATGGAEDAAIDAATQGVLEVGGKLATKALGAGAKAVYRGYLKPSLARNVIGKGDTIVETALREALPISKGGSAKSAGLISDLNAEVEAELATTPGVVDLKAVADRVRQFARAKYFKPGQPLEDYEAALKVADRLDKHPSLPNLGRRITDVSPLEANAIKRRLRESVGASQFGVPSPVIKTTEKVAASVIRKDLEALNPAVGPLNAREGQVIETAKAIIRAVGREANQSMTHGVKSLVAGAVGSAEYAKTRDPYSAAATALATRLALTPAVASRLAIVSYRLGLKTGMMPANVARVALTAIQEMGDDTK